MKPSSNERPNSTKIRKTSKVSGGFRKPIFYIIAFFLPVLILVCAEFLLRAFGFGQSYPLFVESKQFEGYLQPNPDIIQRFFYPASKAPQVAPDTYLFKKEKASDSLRIVAMGGSTMAGFPYGRVGSPIDMLKQRVNATHPQMDLEIISVAMSSINSFSLLDFVDEVIEIDPDAILIYAGHNEYLGVMGVGSSFAGKGSYSANLAFLKLKELRLYQLMQMAYSVIFQDEIVTHNHEALSKTENQPDSLSGRTLMAQVAKEKEIIYKSPLYDAGLTQFRDNLSLILNAIAKHNIPLFVSSIAANEQDLAPFASLSHPRLNEASNDLIHATNYDKNFIPYELLDAEFESTYHADFQFALGHALLHEGDIQKAKSHFVLAQDYDLLRFRAPSAFNAIIKELASTPNDSVYFVDAYKQIEQDTPNGIIGNAYMLEHLHPNARGYFLIAESFYQALLSSKLLPPPQNPVSQKQAYAWQPLSKVDLGYGQFKVNQLMSDYPFTDKPDPRGVKLSSLNLDVSDTELALIEQRINNASFIEVQQNLIEQLQIQRRRLEAGIAAGKLFDAIPQQPQLARVASLLLLQENALPLAEYYAQQAVKLAPDESNFKLSLAEIIYKQGRKAEAVRLLDKVIAKAPDNMKAKQIREAVSR
uniref:tetratricopeptide repeat protein n=1 Tax=Ningiella ruwaisensis TaxID=2364274 RepID=UPI00109F9260|nr:tetratricopeptide repeat protein [Ningiella ruwaisensis]